jgi:hypothetical protein
VQLQEQHGQQHGQQQGQQQQQQQQQEEEVQPPLCRRSRALWDRGVIAGGCSRARLVAEPGGEDFLPPDGGRWFEGGGWRTEVLLDGGQRRQLARRLHPACDRSKKGVRFAQKMRVSPCLPVGIQL